MLNRRLVDIYKRGPLYTWRGLLAAESFGDLLSRYKYLYLTSQQDRTILTDVSRLSGRIGRQRTQLREVLSQLDNRRSEREAEMKRFASLAADRESRCEISAARPETSARINTWSATKRSSTRSSPPWSAGAATARRPRRRRLHAHHRGHRAAGLAGSGRIVYRFGRDTMPGGGVIRWNGIGIGTAVGTPVKAVETGGWRWSSAFLRTVSP